MVIVHRRNPVRELGLDDLRPIFDTTKTSWSDGERIVALNLPPGDAVRDAFDRAVLGLDMERMKRFWVDRRIRGGSRPPKTVPNEMLMVRLVERVPCAVGNVHRRAIAEAEVKVVATLRHNALVAP